MQIWKTSDRDYTKKISKLDRRSKPDPSLRQIVGGILEEVRKDGDKALLRLTKKFDGVTLQIRDLPVRPAEIHQARQSLSPKEMRALREARKNVAGFAKKSLRKAWSEKNQHGARVGERFDPFERVGIYVPGGSAPLVSTAVMTCTLAMVAGVKEIAVTTPPQSDGSISPALLAALEYCGATEIYRAGGAQAIAALAHGTKSIRPVQKVFGPGNAFVVEAKRQLFGMVAVDLLPGPSEILVIADPGANPSWIAADLLAQSEHGKGSESILLSPSSRLLQATGREIARQLKTLQRQEALAGTLKETKLIQTKSLEHAVELANAYAAEHVHLAVRQPGLLAAKLTTSGAIFLGDWSPVAAGDFVAGPSHTLPTGGAGKSFPGLTVDQFQRRTSLVRYDQRSLAKALQAIETFGRMEGLDAHGRSAAIRLES
jgi:histidinol dehydrogenase